MTSDTSGHAVPPPLLLLPVDAWPVGYKSRRFWRLAITLSSGYRLAPTRTAASQNHIYGSYHVALRACSTSCRHIATFIAFLLTSTTSSLLSEDCWTLHCFRHRLLLSNFCRRAVAGRLRSVLALFVDWYDFWCLHLPNKSTQTYFCVCYCFHKINLSNRSYSTNIGPVIRF